MFKVLFFLTIFNFLFFLSYGKTHYISCGECNAAFSSTFGTCKDEEIAGEIYPEKHEITAPKPKLIETAWYVSENSEYESTLALNLTWSQTGKQFLVTHGYILTVLPMNAAHSYLRKISIRANTPPHESDEVVINYPCYGALDSKVFAKLYYLLLRSLPAYHSSSSEEANEVATEIDISCKDERISKLELFCSKPVSEHSGIVIEPYKDEEVEQSSEENSVATSIIVCITSVLLLSFFLIITYCIKQRFLGFHKKSSILLLISTFDKEDDQDHHYLKAADMLCDILKQLGAVDVITNVWNDVNISEPLEWFDGNVKNCKHIVLVCTPLGKKNWMKKNMNDMFVMGYQMYRKQRIKKRWFSSSSHKFSLIYFDANSTVCIPDEMIKDKIKYQNIKVSLPSFFKKVTGKKLCTNLKNVVDFIKFISSFESNTNEMCKNLLIV